MIKIVCLLFLLLCVSSCKPSNPFEYVQISGELIIDSDPQVLNFDRPFKPVKQVNEVCFQYDENVTIEYVTKPPTFPDGKPLLITASLTTQDERTIELNNITRNKEHYLCLTPKEYDWWISIYKSDINFIALTVRSNRKIKISKIEWETYNAWDLK